jgi:hypothetical protein
MITVCVPRPPASAVTHEGLFLGPRRPMPVPALCCSLALTAGDAPRKTGRLHDEGNERHTIVRCRTAGEGPPSHVLTCPSPEPSRLAVEAPERPPRRVLLTRHMCNVLPPRRPKKRDGTQALTHTPASRVTSSGQVPQGGRET